MRASRPSASATRPTASTPCATGSAAWPTTKPSAPAAFSASKEQGDGSQGPIYDRFRKRVIFPICNESGRVIAFTARTLETGDKAGAKYINSPETPLYSKSLVLFNLDKARSRHSPA